MFDLAFDACLAEFALIEIISISWAIVHQSASQWQGEYIGCPGLLDELKGGKAFSEQVQKHFPVHLSKSIIWNGNISGWSARDKQICHVLYATRITMLNFWEHTKFTNKFFYGQWFIISKPDIGILFALIWQRVWQNRD